MPHPDIVLVPGGPGQEAQLDDGPAHEWLRQADAASSWTTSVCTGSLDPGRRRAAATAAGPPRTGSPWTGLRALGARPIGERVVIDGKYVTAAGVSAGIDMALGLSGRIAGTPAAQAIQLMIEYDPRPPLNAGSPRGTARPGHRDAAPQQAHQAEPARSARRAAAAPPRSS